ncbi:dyslexia-associated protein KIAA0319-like protein [Oratosquilla oratoria]|uniref:dyslexia-associated protein KIAA0319-like protein n=1 Tax=Oratosquilla oratoria TaxID=337810 RepID=UPI003F75ABE7
MDWVHLLYYCGLMSLLVVKIHGAKLSLPPMELLKSSLCPTLDTNVYENSLPSGAKDAGEYEVVEGAKDLESCVENCCKNEICNIAILHDENCINLVCKDSASCTRTNSTLAKMVVVREVGTSMDAEWLKDRKIRNNITHMESKSSDALVHSSTKAHGRYCEYGIPGNCGENEECVTYNDKRRDGQCQCKEGFQFDENSKCEEIKLVEAASLLETTTVRNVLTNTSTSALTNASSSNSYTNSSTLSTTTSPTESPIEKLIVKINNKTVHLQKGLNTIDSPVPLAAYAIGDVDFKYHWISLSTPKDGDKATISDAYSQTVTLSNLVEGVYVFKVTVQAVGAYGEAVGNITVLPPVHINKGPVAMIEPATQSVKLPNSGVILDGSGSSDDDAVTEYHWEIVTGPLGYKLTDQTGSTLQLTDLVPGNFTIMLRVQDKEGLEDSATAQITVIKEPDYPPTANAGGDQIIYLPKKEIVLCGNASTDDHGIVEWEWTKGPEDSGQAVDMQDTRTAFLHLSNMVEGHYQFTLRVKDAAGQSSTASVHVYVQKPSLTPPKANAGEDVRLVLPNTTTILDGSHTLDAVSTTHWLWKQLRGPNKAHLLTSNLAKVNVTGLTKGDYVFSLTVWNGEDSKKNSSDEVTVHVIQDINVPPKANAGGDFSVVLPASVVRANGSNSVDDVAITKWLWERDPNSLAAGTVISGSDHSPVLMLTDVVAGRYLWRLTVWDAQGAASTDTVSIIVKEDSHQYDEVELVIGADISSLSQSQLTNLCQELQLLLHKDNDISITLLTVNGLTHSEEIRLTFLAYSNGKIVSGPEVASSLRHQLNSDSSQLLDIPVLSVDTVICQNNCSGHGECVQATRECRCHTWWMESFTRRHMGDGVPNCDWSVVYVFVGSCFSMVLTSLCIWLVIALVTKRFLTNVRPRRKPPRYSLLDNQEDGVKSKLRVPSNLLDSGSDSDSDAEVLLDLRKGKHRNDKQRNGYHKLQRIRT